MKWTSERPTKPGYYWCKHHDICRHADDIGDMDIGHVEIDFDDGLIVCMVGDDVDYPLSDVEQWSDEPIIEPE